MPRLDKHLRDNTAANRTEIRRMLAQGRVLINGAPARDAGQRIGQFDRVLFDDTVTQNKQPYYVMFHKPKGVVCATKDTQHATVVDVLRHPFKEQLHIAGRLDFNSTGMVLLTNDGAWSRKVSAPGSQLLKRYRVTTERPITAEYISAFQQGMYFAYEDIITRPAELTIIDERTADVGLREGRYHHIKRLFGRLQNKVLSIHRHCVGGYTLGNLGEGDYRDVSPDTVWQIKAPKTVDNP